MIKRNEWKSIKRSPKKKLKNSSFSIDSLPTLYSSWTKLPNEEKASYKLLRNEFGKNYAFIKNALKPEEKKSRLLRIPNKSKVSVMDLKEQYFKLKAKNFPDDTDQHFITAIKESIDETKHNKRASMTSGLKNTIFDTYITIDEPLRKINDSQMNRIVFKEQLMVTGLFGEIFISGVKAASDLSMLMKNNIKAILSIGSCKQMNRYISITGGYLSLPIIEDDTKISGFKENYQKAVRFLNLKLKEGNVLVCCYYGICRSCAIVISYLMNKYTIKLNQAYAIVKSSRKNCELSKSAILILNEIELNLFAQPE